MSTIGRDERPPRPLLRWYDEHARDLPWRGAAATPWSVMVSEYMLQQTPVARVLPVHAQWLDRWPTPADLAAEPTGEAIRMWGRLGYPRRALRLHAAATAIVEHHGGRVPAAYDALRALPGVGDYTAAAIAVFAFGQRHAVLDTNVRRVLARVVGGEEFPPTAVDARRARAGGRAAPRRRRRRRDLVDRADGARRAGVHGAPARAATPARSRTGAPGGRPAPRRTTDRRGAARPGPAPTGSAGAG